MFGFGTSRDKKYISDVKTRTKKVRSLQARIAFSALGISIGIVLAVLILWKGTEATLNRFVYNNPAFAIDRLDLQTDGIIPLDQIRKWAGVKIGDNLLKLDLHQLKRNLELVPLIANASIERVLPRRLNVRIIEREPIARIRIFTPRPSDGLLEAGVFYLDEEGVVIPPLARALNTKHFDAATEFLPTLTGISPTDIRSGYPVQSQQILAAIKWIKEYKVSPMTGYADVVGIDLSSPGTLVVNTAQGTDITFASRNFEGQLARWRQIHDFARRSEKLLASLDLAVTNYVPASWQEPLTNSPAQEFKPNKKIPYKKRHV